jgi:hypothetical protein
MSVARAWLTVVLCVYAVCASLLAQAAPARSTLADKPVQTPPARQSAPAAAASCPNGVAFESVLNIGADNVVSTVAVTGTFAYVGTDDSITIFDVSNPSRPIPRASLSLRATQLRLVGNLAYVADTKLNILSISNPISPTLLSSYSTANPITDVRVVGNRAYLIADTTMVILDVSDPAHPRQLGSYAVGGSAGRIDVVGGLAYVARTSPATLDIVDVSDPAHPALRGRYFGDAPIDVQAVGGRAYIVTFKREADVVYTLKIIDASNPTSPTLQGSYQLPGRAFGLQVIGNLAYVAAGGLVILNVTDPTNPTLQSHTLVSAADVLVLGDRAYLAGGRDGLQIIDVSDPAQPDLLGNYTYLDAPAPTSIQVVGDRTYLTEENSLLILDLTTSISPTIIGRFNSQLKVQDAQVVSNLAYLATAGLTIVDVANPTSPTLRGQISLPALAYRVQIVGNLAYVANGANGLRIIDVSDPAHPTLRGGFATTRNAVDVQVIGDRAYVVAGDLEILDVHDPAHPTLLGSYAVPSPQVMNDAQIVGRYAYISSSALLAGFNYEYYAIVDVSDAAHPTLVLTSSLFNGRASVVRVIGDRVYITGTIPVTVDVSDPDHPRVYHDPILGPSWRDARDLDVYGDLVYVAADGLQIFRAQAKPDCRVFLPQVGQR